MQLFVHAICSRQKIFRSNVKVKLASSEILGGGCSKGKDEIAFRSIRIEGRKP